MIRNKQIKIGLTGGIATGKSQVTNYLIEKNIPVIDADKIAREVVAPNSIGLKEIKNMFGGYIVKEGLLDREALGKIIFHDSEARIKLNNILHPLIYGRMKDLESQNTFPILFFDIPLLFENLEEMQAYGMSFDQIWLVDTPMDLRIKRLMKRDSIEKEYALKKISSQMPMEEKRKLSHVILENDKDLKHLYLQIDLQLEKLEGNIK